MRKKKTRAELEADSAYLRVLEEALGCLLRGEKPVRYLASAKHDKLAPIYAYRLGSHRASGGVWWLGGAHGIYFGEMHWIDDARMCELTKQSSANCPYIRAALLRLREDAYAIASAEGYRSRSE